MVRGPQRTSTTGAVPPFLALASHPIRWRLLQALTSSDRTVAELTATIGEPQNLVSYHLALLRHGGFVSARRSSADRRDRYYAIDLQRCRRHLDDMAGALHPALVSGRSAVGDPGLDVRPRVLFVCTGNSARSQMAEALLGEATGGRADVASAGSHPKPLHPMAVRAMRRRGIDIGSKHSKHLDEFRSQPFDRVITLCDRVRRHVDDMGLQALGWDRLDHWSMANPADPDPGNGADDEPFERAATEIEMRVGFLVPTLSPHRDEEVMTCQTTS